MIDQDYEQLKIIDFGLSSNLEQQPQPKGEHMVVGTQVYGSINQNRGFKVSQKDDLESAIYCIFRLLLKSIGISDLPWVPKSKSLNEMILLKSECLVIENIISFIKK